ncbi:hypothetical protein BKA69DRAFT_148666 [Paraphysoderma sedebokerense]|nr:hypothetical protein BKA69DRAFT_148666 [Paraphysoderma sedebokerense]
MLGVLPPSLRFLLPIPLLLLLLPSFFSRSANATSSEFRVDPSSPSSSTSFRSLRSAWRYLYSLPSIESNDNITIQIFPGIHRLPESQFKFNSSLNIYHVALNSSNTFIQPPRNQSRQQSAVLIQDSALLSFEGITFQRFSYSNASLEASSSFFEVIDNAKLIFENCTFSDNGVEKAGFTLSAKDNAAISFHESNLISELAHEAEIYLNGNAKLSMSSSRITGVGSWRTAVFRSFASSSIDIRDSTFTGNRNLLFSVNDFSNLNISNSEFTGNSAPPNAAVTVALVTTATVNIFRSNFSGNFGARTGALSFVGSTVSIQDTDINNNNGTAISAIRISSNSDVTLQNCSIRNHSGPKIRILQVTETAKLSIVGGTIIGLCL